MRGVDVAVDFWACAGEVEDCFALGGVDCDFELDGAAVVHVVCGGEVLALEAGADFAEEVAHAELGVVLDVVHVELDHVFAVVGDEGGDEVDALLVGGNLGF